MAAMGNRTRTSSVTRAIRVLGDRWSILIIRDAFQGVRRFQDFLARTGTSRATLTNRLRSLVANGILKRVPYSDAPPRDEYRLTDKGRDLFGLSLIAWRWERRWAPRDAGIPTKLIHRTCGHVTRPVLACGHCGIELTIRDTCYRAGPGANARAPVAGRFRRLSSLTSASHRGTETGLTHIADIVGDPWTPMVLATAFFGLRRFDEMQKELGIATNVLADRLELLVREKIFRRRLYQRRPPRHEYRLTDKGRSIFGYALLLNAWGDRWLATSAGPPYFIVHRACEQQVQPVVRCSHCHDELKPGSVAGREAGGPRATAPIGAPGAGAG